MRPASARLKRIAADANANDVEEQPAVAAVRGCGLRHLNRQQPPARPPLGRCRGHRRLHRISFGRLGRWAIRPPGRQAAAAPLQTAQAPFATNSPATALGWVGRVGNRRQPRSLEGCRGRRRRLISSGPRSPCGRRQPWQLHAGDPCGPAHPTAACTHFSQVTTAVLGA